MTNEVSKGSTSGKETLNPNEELNLANNVVPLNEAVKFSKLHKRSDYKMVDQLHQKPLKISILSLLLKSEAREVPLNVLNQAHVTQSIIADKFDGVVSNITSCSNL